MKKLALLLALGLLAACGSGGGDGTSAQSLDPNQSSTIALNVVRPKSLDKTVASAVLTDMRRIIITNPTVPALQGWSKTIPDYQESTQPVPFTLYVANGYQIEVLDYSSAVPTAWVPTFYGKATFDVTAAGPNTITVLEGAVVPPSLTPPATIVGSLTGSTSFTATAAFPATTGVVYPSVYMTEAWTLLGGYTAASLSTLQNPISLTATQASPSPIYNGTDATAYYLRAKFYLKSNLRKSTDSTKFDYATAVTGSIPLSSPIGSITPPIAP